MVNNMQKINYLKMVTYSRFNLWDVKRYYKKSDLSFDNVVMLRDILKPYRKTVSKEEMIKNRWQIIAKINFGGQLFLRDFEEIKTYKGSLNLVPENALIYSKINVRHGCIYFNEIGNTPFGVSNEYPTFTFDDTLISGDFLRKVLRSNAFKNLLNSKTSGISKARVKQDEFLDIEIPLPSLEEQSRIVAAYNENLKQAEQLDLKAEVLENDIEKYLFEELGVEKEEKIVQKKGMRFFSFSKIERWDAWVIKNINQSNKYKSTTLSEVVIGKPFYGANVRGIKKKSDTRYIRITDINETGDLNDDFVSPEFVDDKYLLKENDFLIARSGNTVGKTFLFKEIYGRCMFAGYLVKYTIDYDKILPDYLLFFTKSQTFKKWINSNQRVSGQPNINGQEFLTSPLLLPPIDIQLKIIQKVNLIKEEIRSLNSLSKKSKEDAIVAFEKEIFN
jgi:type I restriction enzyme S subunit